MPSRPILPPRLPARRGLAAAITALLLPLPLAAATAASADAGACDAGSARCLDAIVVTAKGYADADLGTPVAVVVAGREAIAGRGHRNLGELLRGHAGLAVNADSAQGQNPVLRGLKRESVVLLADGMRLNSAQPAGAIASFLGLGLAERVEVVKGPASVLYGSGALGGVVNVLTPQAGFDAHLPRSELGLQADGGARGGGVSALLRQHGERTAVVAGAALLDQDDYRAPGGRVADTGYRSEAALGQVRHRFGAGLEGRLSLQAQRDLDVAYPGSTRPHPHPQVGSTTVYSPEQQRRLVEFGLAHTPVDGGGWSLDARVYRQDMRRQIFGRINGPLAAGAPRDLSQTRVRFETTGADLRADRWINPDRRLLFGVQHWRMNASPDRLVAAPPTFALRPNPPFVDGRVSSTGLFVQDDWQTERLHLLSGLRWDRVEGRAAAVAGGRPGQSLERRDSAFSGSLGAVLPLHAGFHPYASLSRGFRAGEMRERFEASPRTDGFFHFGNPQIRPELSTQFELGAKGEHGGTEYRVAVYRNRISDHITGRDVSGPPGSNGCPAAQANACKETVNMGRVRINGLELSLRHRVAEGHWLGLEASRLRGTNRDLDEPLFQMPADELTLGWDGVLGHVLGGRLDGELRWRAVRRQDRVATVFSRGTEDPTAGFTTGDFGLSWSRDGHRLRLVLENLADKAYHEHLTEGLAGAEPAAPGRNLRLSWLGRF
jgi:hemoglobin/transferrin/lactoferrin receptor protein